MELESPKVGEIALFTVDANYKNKGIDIELLSKLFEEFKKAGADIIILNCSVKAIGSKELYDELGFEVRAYDMKRML